MRPHPGDMRTWLQAIAGAALCLCTTGLASVGNAASAGGRAFDPLEFGARGDRVHDDWPGFQGAVDAAADSGGVVIVSALEQGREWRLSQALRMRSHVTVQFMDPEAKIICGGAGDSVRGDRPQIIAWPLNGCVIFGSYTPETISAASIYSAEPIKRLDVEVSLVGDEPSNPFRPKDIVVIESSEDYIIGRGKSSYHVPLQLEMAVVTAVGRRTISLSTPTRRDYAHPHIRLLTATDKYMVANAELRVPVWATQNARLIGGNWEAVNANAQPFTSAGGAINCEIAPTSVRARTGAGYGNLYSGCKIRVAREYVTASALEFGYGSWGNDVEIGSAILLASDHESQSNWVFGLGESSSENKITVDETAIQKTGHDLVYLARVSQNEVKIRRVHGGELTGFLVRASDTDFVGAAPATSGNIVTIGSDQMQKERGKIATTPGADRLNSLSVQ